MDGTGPGASKGRRRRFTGRIVSTWRKWVLVRDAEGTGDGDSLVGSGLATISVGRQEWQAFPTGHLYSAHTFQRSTWHGFGKAKL